MDPRYKATVRNADQTVHSRLAKSKLASLLDTVKGIGYSEIHRFKKAVGEDGSVVSLHTLMYRLGYNVNCIGIFGPQLDHVATRVVLQTFTEVCVSSILQAQYSTKSIPPQGSTYAVRLVQLAYTYLVEYPPDPRGSENCRSASKIVQSSLQVSHDRNAFS